MHLVGGVAQWLGRRSLAGRLFLIYAGRDQGNQWLTCNHYVGKVSATGQPTSLTQPPIHSGSVNE